MIPRDSFIVLLDTDDLACVQAVCPEALHGRVLAFDLGVHLALLDLGIPHSTPWDFATRATRPDLEHLDQVLWELWREHARVPFEGFNLLRMTEYRHRAWIACMAWIAHVIQGALATLRPSEVIVFEEPHGHGLSPPADYHKMPVLFMLVRGIAEQMGISVRVLASNEQPGRPQYTDRVAQANPPHLEPVELAAALGDRDFILFAGSGHDLVRQLPLIRQINEDGQFLAVQIYRTADRATLDALQANGHPVWHDSQVVPEVPLPDLGAAKHARDSLKNACRTLSPAARAVFLNPRLEPHFEFLFGEYARKMARHALVWRSVFRRFRPAAVAVNHIAALNDVAAEMGIPGLVLPHGLVMPAAVRRTPTIRGFHVGVVSELHRRKLVEAGVPDNLIHVAGDVRIDEILDEVRRMRSQNDKHGGIESVRRGLGLGAGQRLVLLATGNLGRLAQSADLPTTDWADAVRCLESVASLAIRHPQWRWAVKPHPRFDQPVLYERVNRTLPVETRMLLIENVPLSRLVQAADVVVVFNVITSAIIEASFHATPVIVLSQSMCWYRPDEYGMQGWCHVASASALERRLELILTDAAEYERLVAQTRTALRAYLGAEPTPAARRYADLLRDIAEVPSGRRCAT